MICGSDLEGKVVRDSTGKSFGCVFEIQIKEGSVDALICGRRGFWKRFTGGRAGHRIPWSRVQKIGRDILIATE
jgi:sporulation protein YlmC with PRC-barrel domain